MLNNDELLDRDILVNFDGIFRAMSIDDYQIISAIQDMSLPPLDFDTREKLSTDGLLAAKNFADEWLEVAEPQLYFKYKKRVVIMYQLDQFLTRENYLQRRYRPYHLCFCKALQEAHEKNRYESRYVMTYNTSGKFKVNLFVRDKNSDGTVYTLKKEQGIILPLKVCQYCLREINWKHFRSYCGGGLEWWRGGDSRMRYKIVNEFNLEEYLVTARQDNFFEHPVFGTASSTIKKEYVLSPQIKEALKKIVDYTCEICREQFPANELQIHHKNHNEGDNRRQNLMVVCADCHVLIHEAEGGFVSRREKVVVTTPRSESKDNTDSTKNPIRYRLYDIINEFHVEREVLFAFLHRRQIKFKNRFSLVDEDVYQLIKATFGQQSSANPAATDKKRTLSAAEYAAAQKNLGDMYANGWGVPKDESKAQVFYRKSLEAYKPLAKAGDVDAQFEIIQLGRDFGSVQYTYEKVFAQYLAQLKLGDVKAKTRLGLMYAKGLGVQRDLYEAKKFLASIKNDIGLVDSELVELCLLVGNINDAMKLHAKAVQLFEIAAKNGDKNAPFELAKLYSFKDLTSGNEY